MPQFNMLNVRDTAGLGREDRQRSEWNALRQEVEQTQFDDDQRLQNTQWLAGAARYGMDNPQAISALVTEGKRRGIIDPNLDARGVTPESLLSVYHGAMAAAGGGQPAERQILKDAQGLNRYVDSGEQVFPGVEPKGPNKTPAQSNYEYGLKNPGFVDQQNKAAELPNEAQEYEYFAGLDDEQKKEYLQRKRGDQRPSSTLEKRLFDVNDAAFDARSKAHQYEKLASDLIQVDPQSGKVAEWTERLKTISGNEDAVTLLRKNWNNLRVGAAVQNLPPGVASDKDIELVMSAFLPEFAEPSTVASFMRGLSKLESIKAEYHEFESDYLSKNKTAVGMGEAWRQTLESTESSAPVSEVDMELHLQQARDVISQGADVDAVKQRLRENGVDPSLL